jgi:tetratricopeptide (TPR) repeat protein
MTVPATAGEALFKEGLRRQPIDWWALPEEQVSETVDIVKVLYERALEAGLSRDDEISCRALLVFCLKRKAAALGLGYGDVMEKGLGGVPILELATSHLERALELDSTGGGTYFGKKGNRLASLQDLGMLWYMQGTYLQEKEGPLKARSYLEAKYAAVAFLDTPQFPQVCLDIGNFCANAGDNEAAGEWFRRAVSAEDAGPESTFSTYYAESKRLAAGNLTKIGGTDGGTSERGVRPKGVLIAGVVLGLLLLGGGHSVWGLLVLGGTGFYWWRR